MKLINELSDQSIGIIFLDRTGKIIDPSTININVTLKSTGSNVISFSANKGIYTNCTFRNVALVVFEETNKLGVGIVKAEYTLNIDNSSFSDTQQNIHNITNTDIEIVKRDTHVQNQAGTQFFCLALPSICVGNEYIKPAAADEQWVKDEVNKYVQSPAFSQAISHLNLMQNDMGNVDEQGFQEKFNDMIKNPDVALKAVKGGVAESSLANVLTPVFDNKLLQTQAYKTLANKIGKAHLNVAHNIKYLEEQGPVDFSTFDEKIVHLVYQFTQDNEVIKQTLPAHAEGISIVFENHFTGHSGCQLQVTPAPGESFAGISSATILNSDGVQGVAIPENNFNGYDWISRGVMHDFGLILSDDKGDVFVGDKNIKFANSKLQKEGDDVVVTYDGNSYYNINGNGNGSGISRNIGFEMPLLTRAEIDSHGKQTAQIVYIKHGYYALHKGDGICLKCSSDEHFQTNKQISFNLDEPCVSGGTYIYQDITNKAVYLQETDQLDPNVTGGTPMKIMAYFEPRDVNEVAPGDGFFELKVINANTGEILRDVNNQPIGVRMNYAQGDVIRPMVLKAIYSAKGMVSAKMVLDTTGMGSDVIVASSRTCFAVDAISKNGTIGLATLAFTQITGIRVNDDVIYYGNNTFDFNFGLQQDETEEEVNNYHERQGDGTFISSVGKSKISIANSVLTVKDNDVDLPVFSVGYLANEIDTRNLLGMVLKVTTTLIDKDDAYRVDLMTYKGASRPTLPILTGYSNTTPQFTTGWTKVSDFFITEDVVSGEHTVSHDFTIPDDETINNFAILMYPVTSQIPTTLKLKDLKGDITPAFHVSMLADNSNIAEEYLKYRDDVANFATVTPAGDAAFRYTVNKAVTKLPWGNPISKNDYLINAGGWHSNGNTWDVEGDGQFKESTKVFANIEIPKIYCGESVPSGGSSTNYIYLAKVDGDTLTEVVGSKKEVILKKSVTTPTNVLLRFEFDVQKDDKYRLVATSSINDGMYIQSAADKIPLIKSSFTFKSIIAEHHIANMDEVVFVDGDKPVEDQSKYQMEIDVKTGQTTIKSK